MLKKMNILKFFTQVKQETKKVVWPDKKELIGSTVVVLITVVIFSFVSLVLDYSIHGFIQTLLSIGK